MDRARNNLGHIDPVTREDSHDFMQPTRFVADYYCDGCTIAVLQHLGAIEVRGQP